LPESWRWQNINPPAILETITENRDIIKGIKLRAIRAVMQDLGIEVVKVAKRIAAEVGLPLMIHIGIEPKEKTTAEIIDVFTRKMLSLLDKGDILTHIFTWKPGGVIRPDGSMFPEFKEALQRGIILDVGLGITHWSLDIARKAFENGVLPTTISTDLAISRINDPLFSLTATMSRFLVTGISLDQLIEMTTINAARALGEEQCRGSLEIGKLADISLLELIEDDFLFPDGIEGKNCKGNHLLVPRLTLKSGIEIEVHPRFK
jgi:dihydroorotase